jgi:predicted tellurium resistance membrane protein TerC
VTNDPFLVYTSNVFAILGLRSLVIAALLAVAVGASLLKSRRAVLARALH